MSRVLDCDDNSAERTFEVFFYGLNMDAQVLAARGVAPREPRVAHVAGYRVQLGAKAMLLRARGARAYGMLFQLTHREMDGLYAALHEYRAEAFCAVLPNGETVPAISMVHVNPPVHSTQDPAYAAAFCRLVHQLNLPDANVQGVK